MLRDLTASEAQRLILESASALGPETVALPEALSRVLAESVVAGRDLPPADNSAMDGYAVRAADLAGAAADRPVRLPVVFEVAAGAAAARALGAGEAARILTGAPVPAGADSVVRQEDVTREGESVLVRVAPRLRENVRERGEDVRSGEGVLASGALIGPAEVGMLAALGRSVVAVRQRPRVAILSGGDELVEPDGDVSGGRIVASNSYSIAAQCREAGAEPSYLGIARDDPADLERRFRAGLRADVLVSSAGVSVGDRDYVRPVLEKLGCPLVFWGVKIKPGYPLCFGRFPAGDGPLVFGLPGNPVSAMITFELFVRPALLKMAGRRAWFRPLVRATLGERLQKGAGRLHFVRVSLERRGEQVIARSTGTQSSGALRSMTLASGLLIFPAEATVLDAGESANVQVLDEGFLQSPDPGF
ncbi:MAG TPA: gephyrin-like molybdotransferase Glp [Myxococcota bacterium]|jgi:molybdopterin molybdotransferase